MTLSDNATNTYAENAPINNHNKVMLDTVLVQLTCVPTLDEICSSFTRFARIYFFFIGACLFKVSMNIFVKFVRLVISRFIFSLLSKRFKSCRNKSFEKFL